MPSRAVEPRRPSTASAAPSTRSRCTGADRRRAAKCAALPLWRGFRGFHAYRKAASDPTFPKLIKIGARCTRIRAGDLTSWLAAQGRA
jgi:hypothetical protein